MNEPEKTVQPQNYFRSIPLGSRIEITAGKEWKFNLRAMSKGFLTRLDRKVKLAEALSDVKDGNIVLTVQVWTPGEAGNELPLVSVRAQVNPLYVANLQVADVMHAVAENILTTAPH